MRGEMITIKKLKEELDKFPDEAMCHAYEGEKQGLTIDGPGKCGFIYCSEGSEDPNKSTEVYDDE